MRPAYLRGLLAAGALLASGLDAAAASVCDGISTASATPLTTVRVASGLLRPTFLISPPGDVERVFIVQQDGLIRLMKNGAAPTTFLDVAAITRSPGDGGGNEEGLLGLAFHPDYAGNGQFFVYHTDSTGANNIVARYERSAGNPDVADPATRQVVISFAHPTYSNHNGGMIAFGPDDGYLYIATGDGGFMCDPNGNAQNGLSFLGKMLRMSVDTLPYTAPADNPFVGVPGYLPAIWAVGLRNPWRFSFDRLNSDLYIGDVGQDVWEEVDYTPGTSPGGENYGWDLYEADHCANPSCGSQGACSPPGYVAPVFPYDQTIGSRCAVTGGYVYRGCRMPDLRGTYFFADYCQAFIKSFEVVDGVGTPEVDRTAELAPGGGLSIASITSFGEDARGEVYILDRGGEAFKIVPILQSLEVSGPGAAALLLGSVWTWEDLTLTSSHPITEYRVYRQGNLTGPFTCIHRGPTTSWSGGDPEAPASGELFSYVVTAVNSGGQETSPGTGTNGVPRVLSATPCP